MSSKVPRIAYFGLPLGALALARGGFFPHAILLGHTDAPGARRVRRTLGRHALVLAKPELDDPRVEALLASVRPDAILSWFFPRKIPERILRLAPRGAFGTHPSLLPRWRGPDPYFWALYSGDRTTGVSLHRLDREYDTGSVVAQTELTISAGDNAWRLAKRLDRPALQLLLACAERLSAGESLAGSPQDDALATSAPSPDEELLCIAWQRPADEIVRLVRAAAPYPAANTALAGKVVDVLEVAVYEAPLPRALQPADAVQTPAGLVVRAGEGAVLVTCVRDEEGAVLRGAQLLALFPEGLSKVGFGSDAPALQSGRTSS